MVEEDESDVKLNVSDSVEERRRVSMEEEEEGQGQVTCHGSNNEERMLTR